MGLLSGLFGGNKGTILTESPADDALAADDLRRVGALVLEGVHGDRGLVPVGRGLEEVLLLAGRRLRQNRALVAAEQAREQAHARRRAERVGAAEREPVWIVRFFFRCRVRVCAFAVF